MGLLVVGISAMAHRVERSVSEVRSLDELRRRMADRDTVLRERAEQTAAEVASALALSTALAGAGTMVEVATVAVDTIDVPIRPTAASVAIVPGGNRLRMLAARGAAPGMVQALERADLASAPWLARALAGTAVIVDDRDQFAVDNAGAPILRMYPTGSWAVIPFRSDTTVGLLSLYYARSLPLSRYAQHFTLIAEIVASGLERAEALERRTSLEREQTEQLQDLKVAFAQRDRIARTLSTTLLPPRLPRLTGFTCAGWLIPASDDEVAGDFYDLFSVGQGDWVAVLGDVCGKGAEAAAVTSLARYAARVTALDDPDPQRIAEVANSALLEDDSDLFCTMAIVRYRSTEQQIDVTLAGHQRPRLLHAGQVTGAGAYGPAAGLGPCSPTLTTHPFPVGAALVLFSDGITERSPAFGEAQLDAMLLAAPAGDAHALAARIRQHILSVPATRYDDITVLVVSRHT